MNKIISAVLIFLLILLPVNTYASSAEGTTTVSVNYSVTAENTVTVSGTAQNIPKNAKITVTVLKSGKTLANSVGTGTSDISVLSAVAHLDVNESMEWTFDWQPLIGGDYDIYVSSKYFAEPVKTTCYASSNRSTVLDTVLNGTEAQLTEMFSVEENIKTVFIDAALYNNITDTSKIGSVLYLIRDEFETDEEILEILPLCCKLAQLGENPDYKLLDEIVSEVSLLNREFTNADLYGTSSEAIKTETAKRLSPSITNTLTKLDGLFTEALILSGVAKNTSYVSVVPYLDLLQNQTYEANKTTVTNAVVGKDYTMNELLSAIEAAVAPTVANPIIGSLGNSNGITGGSVSAGGGGSSASISGPAQITENIENETANQPDDTVKKELVTFNDVPGTHWAFDAINNLRWKDIVSGNEKGNFLPDNNITRAEIVKMICELYNIEGTGEAVYVDVNENHWCYKYIAAASAKKLVLGDGRSFNPDEFITRQDLAVIINRVTEYYGREYTGSMLNFGDAKSIADYAADAVGKLAYAGILQGKNNGCFEPGEATTRAEAATVIYRLLQNTEGR